MTESETSNGRRGKVERLIDKYNLESIGDRLEHRWTASGDERMSLRDLADEFNHELLRAAMTEAGMQPLDGDVENLYRLLTVDNTGSADRTRAERRLDREGVPVNELHDDFVTYQAVRTYLREHRGASYSSDTEDRPESEKEHIQRLRSRVRTVTDSKIEQLCHSGDIDVGSYRTLVEVKVLCEDCGMQYDVEELLNNGGCACGKSDD